MFGTGLDRPLCSRCFMRAKGCCAFQRQLQVVRRLYRPTYRLDVQAIRWEEESGRFDTELVRHLQRIKDADELIGYIRRLAVPAVEIQQPPPVRTETHGFDQGDPDRLPDFDLTSHLRYDGFETTFDLDVSETTLDFEDFANTHGGHQHSPVEGRALQPYQQRQGNYPVQITDLLSLKLVSGQYLAALGGALDATEPQRRLMQLLNKLVDDLVRCPPIRYSWVPVVPNAAGWNAAPVPNWTPFYCGVCRWC